MKNIKLKPKNEIRINSAIYAAATVAVSFALGYFYASTEAMEFVLTALSK